MVNGEKQATIPRSDSGNLRLEIEKTERHSEQLQRPSSSSTSGRSVDIRTRHKTMKKNDENDVRKNPQVNYNGCWAYVLCCSLFFFSRVESFEKMSNVSSLEWLVSVMRNNDFRDSLFEHEFVDFCARMMLDNGTSLFAHEFLWYSPLLPWADRCCYMLMLYCILDGIRNTFVSLSIMVWHAKKRR